MLPLEIGNGGKGECICFEVTAGEVLSSSLELVSGGTGRTFEKRERPLSGVFGKEENMLI